MSAAPQQESLPNPYVGPRAYTSGDEKEGRRLYGRDREVLELSQLFVSERIVLLFSPSGAGKSSLINAALTPALRAEGFRVLPVMRVAHEPPGPEFRKVAGFNRYVFSALMSLEEGRPKSEQRDLMELAGMRLGDYLESYATPGPEGDTEPLALVFDQFEEILTLDPTDQVAKREFFVQAGEALRDRRRWALFSMREDYVATLDPFVRLIPTALSSTYRLDLLSERSARLAIRKPAEDKGVDFTSEAAHNLVNDLRAVYVQQLDGRAEKQLGPHVDPVQLQVVCYRLWEKLPVTPATRSITEGDAKKGGDVNDALAGYYADSVKAVAEKGYAGEREIRGWVHKHLITEQGVRGQVLRAEGQSQGLDNRAVGELINAHLLRAEQRRGATWIELAHDRLIDPVRSDNAKYRRTLNHLQQQAEEWEKRGRPDWLLLRGEELVEANKWANLHAGELTKVEWDYLKISRRQRARVVLFMAMSLLCVGFLIVAIVFWRRAVRDSEALEAKQEELNDTIRDLESTNGQLETLKKLLERRNISLADDLAQYGAEQSTPLSKEQREESVKANDEYQKIASAGPAVDRSNVTVNYYYKMGDPPKVIQTIEQLGFRVVSKEALRSDLPTNFIASGPAVSPDDVKLLAFALMRVGVQLKFIKCFENSAGRENLIEIGGSSASPNDPPIKVEDIPSQIPPCH